MNPTSICLEPTNRDELAYLVKRAKEISARENALVYLYSDSVFIYVTDELEARPRLGKVYPGGRVQLGQRLGKLKEGE